MLKSLLVIIIASIALVACNRATSMDGTYVVYQIDKEHPQFMNLNLLNDTINAELKSKFLNKRYVITFKDKYATLHPVNGNSEIILSKVINNNQVSYHQLIDKEIGTLDYTLKADTDKTILLAIDLALPLNSNTFKPVQLSTNDQEHKHGMAICHLSKVE